jgi:hypothetical protein
MGFFLGLIYRLSPQAQSWACLDFGNDNFPNYMFSVVDHKFYRISTLRTMQDWIRLFVKKGFSFKILAKLKESSLLDNFG